MKILHAIFKQPKREVPEKALAALREQRLALRLVVEEIVSRVENPPVKEPIPNDR